MKEESISILLISLVFLSNFNVKVDKKPFVSYLYILTMSIIHQSLDIKPGLGKFLDPICDNVINMTTTI